MEKLGGGFDGNFTIYDTDDSKRVIKDILKDLGLNDKEFQQPHGLLPVLRGGLLRELLQKGQVLLGAFPLSNKNFRTGNFPLTQPPKDSRIGLEKFQERETGRTYDTRF